MDLYLGTKTQTYFRGFVFNTQTKKTKAHETLFGGVYRNCCFFLGGVYAFDQYLNSQILLHYLTGHRRCFPRTSSCSLAPQAKIFWIPTTAPPPPRHRRSFSGGWTRGGGSFFCFPLWKCLPFLIFVRKWPPTKSPPRKPRASYQPCLIYLCGVAAA